jgi:phage-related holin
MNWRVKQILIVLFGGVAVLALIASFLNTYLPLKVLCLSIFVISFIIAMVIKERKIKKIKNKRIIRRRKR